MKKIYFFLLCFIATQTLSAQENNETGVIIATEFHKTRPIREIFAENPVDESKLKKYKKEESGDRKHRQAQSFPFTINDGPQYGNDERTEQRNMGELPPLPLKANWAGQSASGFRPLDPSGAVGPNHYVQMINSTTFRIYNKSTGAIALTGTLGNLWSPATANAGDPIVMYDKAADRWFLAQFGSGNQIYIAVSQTNDPTGAYYTYTYVSPLFPDYLKFSVWVDGYYMTSNQSTQRVFAFNRNEILAGTPGARSIYINYTPPKSGFFCPLPGDAGDGVLPPAGTPCPIFSYSDNGWGAGFSDAMNIYNMSVNWVPTTPTATITLATNLATAAFDASYNASWNDCPQPGTTQKLDGIGGVCMYRAQWKTWGGYNTIVLNWGVKSSTTQRSIKWAELRQDQTTNVWSIYQEGIYRPDTTATRWMGSIAMDNNGSIGLSYIKSDPTSIYPGLYYTGRRSCDPLGTMTVTETEVVPGTAYQTGTNRIGDYAHTTLDPDGITFWNTSEYLGGTSGGSAAATRIFSYQVTPCGNNAFVNIALTSGSNPTCTNSSLTFTASPINGGSAPVYQWKVNGANVGTNSPTFTTNTLTNGQIVTCVMTSNLAGVTGSPATSNAITVTVNTYTTPAISIALTSGSNPTCPSASLTFTATATNSGSAPSYQWKVDGVNAGTNSATFTTSSITNGQVVTCVVTSSAICNTSATITSNGITITVGASSPSVSIAITSGANPQCAGASTTFTATPLNATSPSFQWKVNGVNVGTNSPTYTTSTLTNGQLVTCELTSASTCPSIATLGTGTTLNSTTSDVGVAYPTYYGNARQQYLIRASELTALGFTAGNIASLSFNIGGTTGNPATMNGYSIKLAHTTSTVMTAAFLTPTFTTVFGPLNYTPILNTWNTHTLSTPFNWDGTSNIVMDICFSNSVTGTVAYQNYQTSSSFVSTAYYRIDGSGGTGACTTSTVTGTGSIRPNIRFAKAAGNVTVASNTITMAVNTSQTPGVSIALTSGTNPACAGTSHTFAATPTNGGTPSYQWKVNGANVGTNSATYSTTALTNGQIVTCVMTSTASCANPTTATSNAITMSINPALVPSVNIALTSGTNPSCAGTSLTFTATPTNGGIPSYQWKVNGINVGTNSATYSTTTLTNGQIVTCVMTSTASCANPTAATSNGITMSINASLVPSVSIALTTGTNPSCASTLRTYTATPTNGGTPSYQWKVNGANVGTNSATFSTTALTNGQIVTCVMTSTALCANPTTATSNALTASINSTLVPSINIALTTGTNPACAGTSLTFTATPTNGGTPSYQWKVNGTNVGTNSATYSSATLTNGQIISCVMTSTASCASPTTATSNAITMGIIAILVPSVNIALTTGTNPACAGTSLTFTATPTNGGTPSYQWKVNGTSVGTNSATYSSATLTNGQIVTCEMTSTANCANPSTATSNAITMGINAILVPSVNIALTTGTNPACVGNSHTFTATPTNGGTPAYQWKVNGTNVGTNSPTYSSTSLTNGQIVSCEMTSTAACANPLTANSNTITMVINSLPIVTAQNVSGCTGTSIALIGIPSGGTFSAVNPYVGASTSYTYSYTDNNGCSATSSPALITVNSPNNNTPQAVTSCNSYMWPVNGITYTSSGIKSATYLNVFGCDSSYQLNLTIKSSSSSTQNVSAINNYTWNANNITYTTSGTYMHTLVNSVGCDSILTLQLNITNGAAGIVVSLKALLAGPYNAALGLMHDSLRVAGMLPTTEPYSNPPTSFPQVGYTGGETTTNAILAVTGNDAIVDWIFVELRSSTNPSALIATKRALIQRDGDIVSHVDGVSPISFPNEFPGSYYVSIKHRNHLGVMTASAVSLNAINTLVDFSNANPVWTNPTILNAPRKVDGNIRLLFVGDANTNKNVKYNGSTNDKDAILNTIGYGTPNNLVYGYRIEDVNMDSKVKYNNTDNDRVVILNSVGPNTPNTILFQHTPN